MEKLKDFLEKWQWASLEEADKTLTESEQKIWELMKKNQDLEKQVAEKDKLIGVYDVEHSLLQREIADLAIKEIKAEDKIKRQLEEKEKRIRKLNLEAQKYYEDAYCNDSKDVIQVADKAIRLLAKALELACVNHPAVCDEANCNNEVDCVGCLIEHYKAQARKELQVE